MEIIGFVVREKTIKEVAPGIEKKCYRDASRLYHAEGAAHEFRRMANKNAGLPEDDNSKFWVLARRGNEE